MPSSRIPPLLHPYIRLPFDNSILLLTSTLGASANWLITRFLCDTLDGTTTAKPRDESRNKKEGDGEPLVVLVSWMREYEFWKQEARKGGGVDLDKMRREGRFAFVDGLSGLFLAAGEGARAGEKEIRVETGGERRPQCTMSSSTGMPSSRLPSTPPRLPVRGAPTPPGRIMPTRRPSPPPPPTTTIATTTASARVPPVSTNSATAASTRSATPTPTPTPNHHTLPSPSLVTLKSTLLIALSSLLSSHPPKPTRTILILDNPDILLSLVPTLTPTSLTSLLLTLNSLLTTPFFTHILTHIQADTPLLALSTPPQPLQVNQHNFLVKMAHMSRRVLSVRVLDTGVARDVSGVLRITERRCVGDLGLCLGDKEGEEEQERGKELLYLVKGDGSVKVFERGAGGEG